MYRLRRELHVPFPFPDPQAALRQALERLGYRQLAPGHFQRGTRFAGWHTLNPAKMLTDLHVTWQGDRVEFDLSAITTGSVRTGFFYGHLYAEFAMLAAFLATGQWFDEPMKAHGRRVRKAGFVFLALFPVMCGLFLLLAWRFGVDPWTLMLSLTATWVGVGTVAILAMPMIFPRAQYMLEKGPLLGRDGRPHGETVQA